MAKSPQRSQGTVLITGGAKRVGAAIALSLARAGYSIGLHYNNSKTEAEKLSKIIRGLGVDCLIFRADLSDPTATSSLIARAYKEMPDLRVLINNASEFHPSSLKAGDVARLDRDWAVHVRAPFILISHFARLKKARAVINILDTNVAKSKISHFSYLVAKKALYEVTRMAAKELAPQITVNGVAPGLILPPEGQDKSYLERLAKGIPLKRQGAPQDIAQAVLFLIENTYITGQTIYVDGGEHLS